MTIELYWHPVSPPSRAVLMVIRHLKLQAKLKEISLFDGEHLKKEYIEINPQHVIPTIVDDGMSLWESRAIMTYLCNQYAPNSTLYPRDVNERALVDRWLQFDLGTLFKAIFDYTSPMLFKGSIKLDKEKENTMKKSMQIFDDQLSATKYVTGPRLTLADISLLAGIDHLTNVMDYDISDFKFVVGWQARLKRELPYYREVCEQGIDNLRDYVRSKINENPASR